MNLLNLIGLVLGFVGTILVAISIGSHPTGFGGAFVDDKGKRKSLAYVLHPLLFKIGIGSIVLGFATQIIPAASFLWEK
jgi:hypothetical protein